MISVILELFQLKIFLGITKISSHQNVETQINYSSEIKANLNLFLYIPSNIRKCLKIILYAIW